jgi:adenylyl-sulfate kinase
MFIVWLTGRPCSGKTTLANSINTRLKSLGWKTELLDGDVIRPLLWPELTFTIEDRERNVLRFAWLANMLARHDILPIVSVVSPSRAMRDGIRRDAGGNFIEVYVNAPYDCCAYRDVKGMYARAEAGKLPNFTGVGSGYEPPLHPEVECHTNTETIEESTTKILNEIDRQFSDLYTSRLLKRSMK